MIDMSPQSQPRWPRSVYEQAKLCFASLPIEDRQMLLMSYIDDLSTQEIASVLTLPYEEVMTRVHAAREQLRRALRAALATGAQVSMAQGQSWQLPPSTAA